MNYLVLVNKQNIIKDNYYDDVKFITVKDATNLDIEVEEITYKAYLKLKEFLETKNIYINLLSAYRSLKEQQDVLDDYLARYGEEYTNMYAAPVGASEHHTGLALDIGLYIGDKVIIENDDLFANDSTFKEIHKYLDEFGFILRYPENMESITGYNYEPWHIRYVGSIAKKIKDTGLTLEEYLDKYGSE